MADRVWTLLALLVGAAVVVAIIATGVVPDTLAAAGLALLLLGLYLTRNLDGWQRLLALLLVLLVCASSHVPVLRTLSFYPRYVVLAALVAWAYFGYAPSGRRLDRWTGLLVGSLWAAAGLAVLSTIWSAFRLHTLQQGLALTMLAALVHVLVTRRWADRSMVARDLAVVYVMLSLSLVASLGYGLAGGAAAETEYTYRFQGIFSNPNTLGMIAAMTIPLGWALYRRSRPYLLLLGVGPAAVALVLSESRTALLAVLLGAAWLVVRQGVSRMVRLATAGAALLAGAYAFGLLPFVANWAWVRELAERFTVADGADFTSNRLSTWQAAIDLWQTRPAFGFGYASGFQLFDQVRHDGIVDVGVNLVHNSHLQWLLELGVAGLAPLLLLTLAALWALLRPVLDQVNPGLVWLVFTGLVIQVTESAIFGTGQPYPYVFWLAVAAVLRHSGRFADRTGQADGPAEPPAIPLPHRADVPPSQWDGSPYAVVAARRSQVR